MVKKMKRLLDVAERRKKVEDLRRVLKSNPIEIVLATDAEGNGFLRLEDIEVLGDGRVVLWPSHEPVEY